MAPEFIRKIKDKFIKDIKDPEQRKIIVKNAVEAYQKRLKSKPNGDDSIYEPLEDLVGKYEQNLLNPIEIYQAAFEVSPSEKKFLRIIVNDIVRRSDFYISNVKYIQALSEIEENCFPYLNYLIKCYESDKQTDNIIKTYELIYSKIALFEQKRDKGEPIPSDLQWSMIDKLKNDSVNYLCQAYINLNRIDDQAMNMYQEVLKNDPDNFPIIKQISRRYLSENRRDNEAVGIYEFCLAHEPDNRELVMALGESYNNIKKPEMRIKLFESYYKDNPKEDDILSVLIEYYIRESKINSETLPYLRNYLKKSPDDKKTLSLIAEYYAGQNEISQDAIDIYEKYLHSCGTSLTIQFILGRYYLEKKSWRDVIRIYEGIRNVLKDSSEAIIPLATAYAQYNRYDAEALKLYERALLQGSRNETVTNILCREYYNKHRRDARTIKIFKDVLTINPNNFFARLGMCDYYEHLGQYSTAIDEAVKLLREAPENEEVLKILIRSITAFDFPDEVSKLDELPLQQKVKILEEVYQKRPKSKTIVLSLADIYLNKETDLQPSETINLEELFKNALNFKQDYIPFLFALSELCYKKGAKLQGLNYDKQIYYICKKDINYHHIKKSSTNTEFFIKVIQRLSDYYLDGGRTDAEAEEVFTSCYSLGKRHSKLILTLAEIFMRKISTSLLAMEIYELALKETSYNPMLEKLLIKARIDNGVYEPVIKFIEEELGKKNRGGEILGFTRELLAKYPEVPNKILLSLENIYKDNKDDEAIVSLLAIAYLKKKRYDTKVLEVYQKALYYNPDNKDLVPALARCYEISGDFVKATHLYEKVSKEVEVDPTVTMQLAKNYQKTNVKNKQALEITKQAIMLDPYDVDLQLFLLDLYFEHGLKKEALLTMTNIVTSFPEIRPRVIEKLEKEKSLATWDVDLFLNLAYLYIDEKRFDDALHELNKLYVNFKQHYADLIDAYNKILRYDPNHIQVRIERAILYKLVGDFEEAIKDLESLDESVKHNPNVLYELAEIYEGYLNTMKEPDPPIMRKLGIIYFEIGEFEKTIDIFQKLLIREKYVNDANYYIARSFQNKEAFEPALDYYKKLEKTEEIKRCLYEMGDRLYLLHDLKNALKAYQQIISSDISFRDVSLKIKELQQEMEKQSAPERDKIFEELSQRAQQRFELIEKIGSGNMGIVYKAYDKELDEIVALKILPEHFSNDINAVNRFKQEAKAARKLSHAHIVRIHDIGEEQGRKYISMEYIDGGDLKGKLFKDKKLSRDNTIKISVQIAEGLTCAHKQNILHRDIKPGNILLTSAGEAKISDFGIAAIMANAGNIDTSGLIMGTPMYMSPEQTEGEVCTQMSDIYSLGIVMYEMISGSPPFSVGNIAYHHIFTKPPALIDIDPELAKIIYKCLEKKPSQRYQSMIELLSDLVKII